MNSISVELAAVLSSGLLGVLGFIFPFITDAVRSAREAKAKRIEMFMNNQHRLYTEFVSAYSRLSVTKSDADYIAFLSAANSAMLVCGAESERVLSELLFRMEQSGGIPDTNSDGFFGVCISKFRDETTRALQLTDPQNRKCKNNNKKT